MSLGGYTGKHAQRFYHKMPVVLTGFVSLPVNHPRVNALKIPGILINPERNADDKETASFQSASFEIVRIGNFTTMNLHKPTRELHAFRVAFSVTLAVMSAFLALIAIVVVCSC